MDENLQIIGNIFSWVIDILKIPIEVFGITFSAWGLLVAGILFTVAFDFIASMGDE